jgi:hypothetical protein
MKRKIFVFAAAIFLTFPAQIFSLDAESSQTEQESESDLNPTENESGEISFDESALKKNYLVALAGMVSVNLVIGGWNRFVSRSGWAQVYWDDIKEPWNRTIKFDRDWYWTNFVLHPYQGGLYYLAGRNANLNCFESLLLSTAGSFMWEYFFETNSPSTNDLVYTSIGGFVTGEMIYRLGLEAASVWKPLSYLANPVRLLTDPLSGHAPQGPTGLLQKFSLRAGFGTAAANAFPADSDDDRGEFFPAYATAGFAAVYGDPYGHDSNTPYSQFELEMNFSVGIGSGEGADSTEQKIMYDIDLFSDGMLWSRNPDWGESKDTSVGFVMEYDFMWHSFMEFSSLGPGVAVKQRIRRENGDVMWQTHLAGIIMGTADTYYLRRGIIPEPDYVSCDYGYTTGFEAVQKYAFEHKSGLIFSAATRAYAMWKYPAQVQDCDDTGWEIFAYTQFRLELPVSGKVALGLEDDFYLKWSLFDNFDDLFSILDDVKFYVRWNLK